MSKSYIKVNSVTHAIKAKNLLNSQGIYAQVIRNDKPDKREGCGYAVFVDGDLSRAESILRNNHVKIIGIGEVRDRL